MKVCAWSQNLTEEAASSVGVERVGSLDELCRRADLCVVASSFGERELTVDSLSVQTKLSDRTRHLIGAEQLRLLGPTSYLVNTSRGPIVDEGALVDALKQGTIAGAGLCVCPLCHHGADESRDVYDVEPLPVDHPLRTSDRVVLTPHIGYGTEECCALTSRC